MLGPRVVYTAVLAITASSTLYNTPATAPLSATVQKLLQEEMLLSVPIVVFGNKIDDLYATPATEGELRAALGLVSTTGKKVLYLVLGCAPTCWGFGLFGLLVRSAHTNNDTHPASLL